ncbi:MAG: nucleotidyltransferase [Elusimicrobiota bacterium]
MGAETERPHSRPPRLEDLLLLCRSLNERGVRYLVIGGFAMILHGYTRGTMDVDLLVDPSPENMRKIKEALARLPDNAAAELSDTDVEKYQVVRVGDEFVVDLLGSACGVRLGDVLPSALHRTVEGVDIPFPDERSLIRMKDTVRPKDRQDILFLKEKLKSSEE